MTGLHDVLIDIVGGVIVLAAVIALVAILENRISDWTRPPKPDNGQDRPPARRHTLD